MIRHIVLAHLRADLTGVEVDKLFADILGMLDKIPGILAVSIGENNSPEPLSRGYTHGFTVDFTDEAARDAYLPHLEHVRVATNLVAATEGGADGILVLDYEV